MINSTINRLKSGPLKWLFNRTPRGAKARVRRLLDRMNRPSVRDRMAAQTSQVIDLLAKQMYEAAATGPRFQDPKRLPGFGFKVYSQHDEDGVIEEIFRRIGTTNRYFVEFGVGDGLENCTLYLLLKGWRGAWIEGSAVCYEDIQKQLGFLIQEGRLKTLYSFVTAENINGLFDKLGVPEEPDLLSVDIDCNDYWIWKAIVTRRPRVVAIEYNASLQKTVACVVPYQANRIWHGNNYYGASLKAFESLGREKGYRLIGCNYTGVTAFFAREDLVGSKFAEPFTAENHFEPPRYYVRMPNGHSPGFGQFLSLDAPPE